MVVNPSLSPFAAIITIIFSGRHLSRIQPFLLIPNSYRARTFLFFDFCCFPQSGKTFCFPVRLFYGGKCSHLSEFIISFRLNWGKCRCREILLSIEIQYGKKCPPSAEFNISSELNWEECRYREILLSIEIQYGKEGLPQIWNKYGWNNKSRSINWLSDILSLILNETIKAVLKLIVWYCIAYL